MHKFSVLPLQIIGANATYLIILIQFHIANNKPLNIADASDTAYSTTELSDNY